MKLRGFAIDGLGTPDFQFQKAYATMRMGDYEHAKSQFTKLLAVSGENDPDILSLLGQCYLLHGQENNDHTSIQHAQYYFDRACSILRATGLPIDGTLLEMTGIGLEEDRGEDLSDQTVLTPTQNWMIKLSPRRYHELRQQNEEEIAYLQRPLGTFSQPGDLCFFATDDSMETDGDATKWRIGAIYTVISEPIWHPLSGYVSRMQLVNRPPEGIPVDVRQVDTDAQIDSRRLPRGHPYRFGAFELEEGALDIITEAISQRRNRDGSQFGPDERITLRRPS